MLLCFWLLDGHFLLSLLLLSFCTELLQLQLINLSSSLSHLRIHQSYFFVLCILRGLILSLEQRYFCKIIQQKTTVLPSETQLAPQVAQRTWGLGSSVSAFLQKGQQQQQSSAILQLQASLGMAYKVYLSKAFWSLLLFVTGTNKCLYGKREDECHLHLMELFIEEQLLLLWNGGSS